MITATSLKEARDKAVVRLRAEISELAEQSDAKEKHIQHMRSLSVLMVIIHAGLIDKTEFNQLGNEIAEANAQAALQVQAAKART